MSMTRAPPFPSTRVSGGHPCLSSTPSSISPPPPTSSSIMFATSFATFVFLVLRLSHKTKGKLAIIVEAWPRATIVTPPSELPSPSNSQA
ncbi:hypothetical protein BKA70DRAFT_1439404 [Coprinopsis sp. MPI-PUGE-AT-0042]|nr:hypothetical protein BKA70DRAFT_1439404 [Coprinopsis sp. MPI-PUGE-AT-0042]